MIRLLGLLLIVASIVLPGSALAARRIAFVAGIDRYDNLDSIHQLKKAVNDARAVGDALQSLGYQVTKTENASRREFLRQWQAFLNALEPGDETAFFFAGHGVEISGQNFLLPRDVPEVSPGEEEVLKAEGLALSGLLDQMRDRHPQVSLYVIDACRDNPFFDARGRSIGGTRGLARVEPPSGTFIMFSAGSQETALDRLSDNDPNPNSIYTRTLLPRLTSPGKITDIARDVRRSVREMARGVAHVQTPAYYDEVVGDFCPAGCEAPVAAASAPEPSQATAEVPQSESSAASRPASRIDEATGSKTTDQGKAQQARDRETKLAALEQEPAPESVDLFGMSLASGGDAAEEERGVAIRAVRGSSEAAEKGLTVEDRILAVGGEIVTSPSDVANAVVNARAAGRRTVLVLSARGDQQRFVALALDRIVAAARPDAYAAGTGPAEPPTKIPSATGVDLTLLRSITAPQLVWAADFSPDGRQLAAGLHNNTVGLWDADTGGLLRSFTGHSGPVFSVAFSPDGTQLISGSDDKTVRVWDPTTGKLLRTLTGHIGTIHSVAISPDGAILASSDSQGLIRLWDSTTFELVRTLDVENDNYAFYRIVFSPDGSRLASAGPLGEMFLWEPANGKLLLKFKVPDHDYTKGLAFSPDGTLLISGGNQKKIRIFELVTGTEIRAVGVAADIQSLVYTPDGRFVVSATEKTIHLWNAKTSALVKSLDTQLTTALALSREGTRLAAVGNGIRIHDLVGAKLVER